MANLRISSEEVFSDLIPQGKADIVIGVEPMEALRHLPMLKPGGWLVTNLKPYVNIPNYPDIEKVHADIRKIKNHVLIDADKIAKEAGNARASNVVMLGAATPFLGIDQKAIEQAIEAIFGRKGADVVELNIKALHAGIAEAQKVLDKQ
jgi:indolepyruvate ferredoxin oxidoreductase beta subunit